jgi:AraC family transcriptional regulator
MIQPHDYRLLEPGEFIGQMDSRVELPSGVICFIARQPHIEPHEHTDTHFVLIAEGRYRTSARNSDGVVESGAIIYNPPGTRHDDQFVGPGGRLMTLALSASMARHFARNQNFEDCASVVSTPGARHLLSRVADEGARMDEISALAIEGLLLELSAATSILPDRTMKPPSWLSRARVRIDEACEELPSVEQLAREARVHPVHFTRMFRRFAGTTPGDYLRRARARRAARLLAQSCMPMSEIALACGFSDQAAFCKAFVRATGLTPGTFRGRWKRH